MPICFPERIHASVIDPAIVTQEIADAVQEAAEGRAPMRATHADVMRLVHGPVAIPDEAPGEQPAATKRGRS